MSSLHHSLFSTISFIQPPITPLRSFIPARSSTLHRITPLRQPKLAPKYKNQTTMVLPIVPLIRAIVCPAVFTVILIQHARNPHRLPALLPRLWPVARSALHPKRAVPLSLLASFRLGRLVQRLQTPSITTSEQEILTETRGLLTREVESLNELRDLEAHLEGLENRVSLTSRLRTALSFANLLWLISIAGLGVTFWPTLKLLFGRVITYASEWFMRIVLPVVFQLHKIGVFEALSYAACTLIVAQAARYLQTFGVGVPGSYVALTAFVGSLLAFWYTLHLHLGTFIKVSDPIWAMAMGGEGLNRLLWGIFQICVAVPLAVVHESELLGFISAVAMMNVLDNVVRNCAFGFIGFDVRETADHLTLSSGIVVAIFVAVRLLGGARFRWLKPLHVGVTIVGNMGYFTGLLVRASRYYYEDGARYVFAQIHMVVSLAAAIGLGKLFGIVSLSSMGTIFGSLYATEKLSELPWGQWVIVAWFGLFGMLYAAAEYLRTHPELLKGLVDGRGLLLTSRAEESG